MITLLLLPGIGAAVEDDSLASKSDPLVEKAAAAIARKGWSDARAILREALNANPANAEYHNLYAYAIRMDADPDMTLVFKHYNEALRIDPQHRGAHEYIGEAYLTVGNVDKAKEHLAVLNRLCFFPCQEYTDLRRAIAAYEKKAAAR